MNENVWDLVTTWRALLPDSITESLEKLLEINLLVPRFLPATSHPEPRVNTACWTSANAREDSIQGFTPKDSVADTLGIGQVSKGVLSDAALTDRTLMLRLFSVGSSPL